MDMLTPFTIHKALHIKLQNIFIYIADNMAPEHPEIIATALRSEHKP